MTVIVLSACPIGLRGQLTRWLMEISPGVFVGRISARVRDELWNRVTGLVGRGRAILVYSTSGEQGLAFKVHGHEWIPEDFEGIRLILRPNFNKIDISGNTIIPKSSPPEGWSMASRKRRFKSWPPKI